MADTSMLTLTDGSVWPSPEDPNDVEWALRYAPRTMSRGQELHAASVLAAYRQLIGVDRDTRAAKVRMIREAMGGDVGVRCVDCGLVECVCAPLPGDDGP